MAIKKPESKFWKALRDGTKSLGVHWTRMESWASQVYLTSTVA